MGRVRIAKAVISNLKEKQETSKKRKHELISYIHRLKESYAKGKISYSRYIEILHKKTDGRNISEWIEYYDNYEKECEKERKRHQKKINAKKIVTTFFTLALISFFIYFFLFSSYANIQFTGFAIRGGEQTQEFSQNLNLILTSSTDYEWKLENIGQLTSLKLNGLIEGEVKIYLGDLLILDSSTLKISNSNLNKNSAGARSTGGAIEEEITAEITGTEITDNSSNSEEIQEGSNQSSGESNETEALLNEDSNPSQEEPLTSEENESEISIKLFTEICEETCDLTTLNLSKSSYILRIEISNAKLQLDTIVYEIISENITISEEPKINITKIPEENATITTIQSSAVLGQPVKWKKQVISEKTGNLTLKIPRDAEKIKVKKISHSEEINESEALSKEDLSPSQEELPLSENITVSEAKFSITGGVIGTTEKSSIISKIINFFKNFFKNISGAITGAAVQESLEKSEIELELEINDTTAKYEIEYETPAPYSIEEKIKNGKRVQVIGPETIHYENVLIFTELDESLNIRNPSQIKIHWIEENKYLPIKNIQDKNNNGIYDYIEWIAPQLSNQTFEIILITKAEHLDSNRNFISDIYEEVKELDDVWSEAISDGDYVRVTFEKNLTSSNDITIYPRITSGTPRIEVYEKDKNDLITEFSSINSNQYNKVFLTNLISESQDVFDLRVVGGSVEFDHIIDPSGPPVTEGLIGHFDANNITGLNDGDSVSQWNDISGNNKHATQTNSVRRPKYKTDVIDGKPAVKFDGVDDSLTASLSSPGDSYTVFAVVYPYSVSAASGDHNLYGYSVMGTTSAYALWLTIRAGDIRHYAYTGATTTYGQTSGLGISVNETILLSVNAVRNTADGANIYLDGNLNLTHTPVNTAWAGSFCIGDLRDNRQIVFDGLIAEILVYNTVLSDADREAVEQYLGDKWLGWVDTTPPEVTINSPLNENYSSSTTSVNATFTINEEGTCWFGNGTNNFSMDTTNNLTFNSTYSVNSNNSYTIYAYCNDTAGNLNDTESVTFFVVPPIEVGLNVLYPLTNINVTQNEFFNVTLNVSCLAENCGTINVSLDPEPEYITVVFNETGNHNWTVPKGVTEVEVLVVAGGGSSSERIAGGGGAGGLIYNESYFVEGTLNITVGAGGTAGINKDTKGSDGGDSIFGELVAKGGGTGGVMTSVNGNNGGSGGGARGNTAGAVGGSGEASQGYAGGSGAAGYGGAGGGGAGAVGKDGQSPPYTGGDGGNGSYYGNIFGDEYGDSGWFAGGGAGGAGDGLGRAYGGLGGGGDGGQTSGENGEHGMSNTGGGGGGGGFTGSSDADGSNGGSGIVIIKYADYGIKSGLIPVGSGTPFYTNASTNPLTTPSLNEGQSEIITFWINATGNVNITHEFFAFANLTSYLDISNITDKWNVTIVEEEEDTEYPQFSNYWDNNASLVESGTGLFNVTVTSTNGTVLLEINNTNITATNLTAEVYNASYDFTSGGTYTYRWHSWGNGSSANYNKSIDRSYIVNTSAQPPTIPWVQSLNPQNPTEDSITSVTFNFTITDENGFEDINISSVNASFIRAGEPTRINESCINYSQFGNDMNFTCTIDMSYFDENGDWTINVSIQDNEGEYAENSSTIFTYNILSAMKMSPTSLGWPEISLTSTDIGSTDNPIVINNTGNNPNLNINVTAYDLRGEDKTEYFIYANNFSVGVESEGCSGITMSNATSLNITTALLTRGNHSINDGTGQEQLYFCLKGVPSGITSQSYSSSAYGAWEIRILLIVLTSAARKRKKKKKEKSIENLEIPITIFTKKLGALEVLSKYLKENLEKSYSEIGKILNRNPRTIWTAYSKAIGKTKEPIEIKETDIFIPISMLKNRKLTVLESIIIYLKEKGMRYSEIAELLERDERNIWTICSNAIKKLNFSKN